jgi:RND family efflux transporter MFP subunit
MLTTETIDSPSGINKIRVKSPDDQSASWTFRKAIVTVILMMMALTFGLGVMKTLASYAPKPVLKEPSKSNLSIDTFVIQTANLQEMISAFGTTRSDREVTITAQVSGEITETFKLDVGERIKAPNVSLKTTDGPSVNHKGDVIIAFDKRDFQQKLQIAEDKLKEDDAELAQLQQTEKNLERRLIGQREDYDTFNKEYLRIKLLFDRGTVTQGQLSQSLLDLRRYEDAVIQLETEQAMLPTRKESLTRRKATHMNDLKQAQIDLTRTEIIPPFNGDISQVYVERGQYVRTGDSLFRMVDSKKVIVTVPVSLDHYNQTRENFKPGEPIPVVLGTSERNPQVWSGLITRTSPQADQKTRTIDVFVEVDNEQQKSPLLPGTFVFAKVLGHVHRQVLAVPRETIVNGYVFVVKPVAEVKPEVNQNKTKTPEGTASTDTTPVPEQAPATKPPVDPNVEPLATEIPVDKVITYVAIKVPVKVVQNLQTLAIINGDIQPGDQVVLSNLDKINDMINEEVEFTLTMNRSTTLADQFKSLTMPLWQVVE